jgi:uncharacterized membrane protein YgdD (TMEM256/DUF423 family)
MKVSVVSLGSANAFVAVAAGAFGAHGLKGMIPAARLATWETAAHYHLIHSLALVLIGSLSGRLEPRKLDLVGWLFFAGIILFAGSLYALALSGITGLGAITPFGGVCFLAGWGLLAVTAGRHVPPPE